MLHLYDQRYKVEFDTPRYMVDSEVSPVMGIARGWTSAHHSRASRKMRKNNRLQNARNGDRYSTFPDLEDYSGS